MKRAAARRRLNRFDAAARSLALIGRAYPEDHAAIREEYFKARNSLLNALTADQEKAK